MSDPDEIYLPAAQRGLLKAYRRQGRSAWIQATGRSMWPLLAPGDWLLVDFGREPRRTGDVVLFDDGGRIVAHRVVALRPQRAQILTKGDGSLGFDRPRATADVLGVIRARRRAGRSHSQSAGCTGILARTAARVSLLVGVLARRPWATVGHAALRRSSRLPGRKLRADDIPAQERTIRWKL